MPQPNSIKLSDHPGINADALRGHWHIWALLALMPFRAKPPKPSEVTKTFSAFGQTLIPTFRFSGKQRPNTRGIVEVQRIFRCEGSAGHRKWRLCLSGIVQRPADQPKESVLALQLVEKLPTDIYKFVVSLRSPDRHEDEQTAIIAGIHAVSISLCNT